MRLVRGRLASTSSHGLRRHGCEAWKSTRGCHDRASMSTARHPRGESDRRRSKGSCYMLGVTGGRRAKRKSRETHDGVPKWRCTCAALLHSSMIDEHEIHVAASMGRVARVGIFVVCGGCVGPRPVFAISRYLGGKSTVLGFWYAQCGGLGMRGMRGICLGTFPTRRNDGPRLVLAGAPALGRGPG